MKITCPYCNTKYDDTLTQCPQCGAPSEGVNRTADSQPVTIEQLKKWYQDRGLPPYETTRFFIGEDYREPRAFGIYQDFMTGNFVVYKNLGNGDRKIRYQGTDEAYAVNELYMRLKQEILQQKDNAIKMRASGGYAAAYGRQRNYTRADYEDAKNKLLSIFVKAVVGMFVFFIGAVIAGNVWMMMDTSASAATTSSAPSKGYYQYDNTSYYHADYGDDKDDWYVYDTDKNEWKHTYNDLPDALASVNTSEDFYYTPTWDTAAQEGDFATVEPFENSSYAEQYESQNVTNTDSSSDDDDSWDWDKNDDSSYDWSSSDSWSSGSSDWDSNW